MICPDIRRQRLIIEGFYELQTVDEHCVRNFLAGLTDHLGMTRIAETLVFSPDAVSDLHHGVGGFQAWAESGCSLYTWSASRFFTLDVYSCKAFDVARCVDFVCTQFNAQSFEVREV